MAREDYEQIKQKFEKFVNTWKTRDATVLENIVHPEIKCYMSIAKAYPDGSQHSKVGIQDFVRDFPQTDVLHINICNYVCRLNAKEAQQYAEVVCRAANFVSEKNAYDVFEFTTIVSNHWVHAGEEWLIDEIRMDVVDHGGELKDFFTDWHFESAKVEYFPGIHLPCLQGELDSPWVKIKDAEDILTEEEKVIQTFWRYNYGVDTLSFENIREVLSDNVVLNMQPFGSMNKRIGMETLKCNRQKNRYWAHPYLVKSISIQDDLANVEFYRVAGHKQRNHPYRYTMENIDSNHADAKVDMLLRKENGAWKILKFNYFLGIIDF